MKKQQLLKQKMMKNLSTKIVCMAVILLSVFQTANAQQTREFERYFIIDSECFGYVFFDATFTGFASRLSVKNTELYLVSISNSDLEAAVINQGITKKYHSIIGASAYKIPRFTLYLEGYAQIGGYYSKIYSKDTFTLQVSETLGDYTTPEFDIKDKSRYTGSNSWEETGSIADGYPGTLKVTEIYFKDYDIRIKD